jgi:hypothetical protein
MTIHDNLQFCCFSHTSQAFRNMRGVSKGWAVLLGLWLAVFAGLFNTATAGQLPPQQQVSSVNLEP